VGNLSELKHFSFIVDSEDDGERLDVFLNNSIPELSRSRVQKAIRNGDVVKGGEKETKQSKAVHEGEKVELTFSPPRPLEAVPEDIPLDILYEDDNLLVVNKPAGMVVHPAPGHRRGTMVNALLYHCDNLSGIGGVLRPGIVHRLDKGSSGLLVVAKDDRSHISLSRQLAERKVKRIYRAIIWGEMKEKEGAIDRPIGRSPRNRKKMAVVERGGRSAVTYYRVLDTNPPFQYIEVKLGTGRTHQIRVHLSHISHPVLGDPVYGGRKLRRNALGRPEMERAEQALSLIERQALHAGQLSFLHPRDGEVVEFKARPPDDFSKVLERLELVED
jgi:23S rRNA pseudouridine1911/1915/1917 synthase